MSMDSFMVPVIPWDSLSMMETLSSLKGWPMVLIWSSIGEAALKFSLYLSSKVLPISPMYSTVHPKWSHFYLSITPPLLVMFALSYIGACAHLIGKYGPSRGYLTPHLPLPHFLMAPIFLPHFGAKKQVLVSITFPSDLKKCCQRWHCESLSEKILCLFCLI